MPTSGLSHYPCKFCKGWHLGNNPKKIQLRLDQLFTDRPTKP
jgi:hypothetical protein